MTVIIRCKGKVDFYKANEVSHDKDGNLVVYSRMYQPIPKIYNKATVAIMYYPYDETYEFGCVDCVTVKSNR